MALFYNPTSIQAASLLQRRPMSEAQKQEALSKALQEQMANDPRSGQIQDWRDRSMKPFGVGAGLTGVAAQMASALVAKSQEKKLAGDYQDRQAKQSEAYARILGQPSNSTPGIGGEQPGGSPTDTMTPEQRRLMSVALETGNTDLIEAFAGQVAKSAFDPAETPSYQTYTGSDGQQYAWNPKNPGEQPRALPNSQKPDDFENIETVIDGKPGIYRQNKRTGAVGDFVGALPPKQPGTVVNIDNKAEGAGRKAQAEASSEIWKNTRVAAQAALEFKSAIQQFREAAKGTPQGPVSSYSLPIRSALNEIGLKDDAIPNQEAMNAATASMVIADAKKLGTNPTDRDSILLERKSAALGKTPEGNAIILNYGERAADRKIQEARWMSDYLASPASGGILGSGWDDYIAKKQAENPLLTPEERKYIEGIGGKPGQTGAPATSAYSKTAVNPKTGEKAGWDGSKWVKIP